MRSLRLLAAGTLTFACFATTPPAMAETGQPVLAESCSAEVTGKPGQQVMLDPAAVAEPVSGVLAGLDPLGLLAGPFQAAWREAGPIPIGTVSGSDTEIGGAQVADAVTGRLTELPLAGPVLKPLVSGVDGLLTSLCGLLVRSEKPPAPPTSAPPAPPQSGSPAGGPGASTAAGAPFTQRPALPAGSGAVFGERLSGLLASGASFSLNTAGVPGNGVDTRAVPNTQPAAQTGDARALPNAQRELSPPILLAVLLLTAVSAQLVRRWALGA